MPQPHFVKIYKKLFSDYLHTQNLPFLLKNAPKLGKKSAQLEKNNYPVGKIKFPSWKIDFFQLGVFRPLTGRSPKNTYKAVFAEFVKKFSETEVSLIQCLIPKPSFRLLYYCCVLILVDSFFVIPNLVYTSFFIPIQVVSS